MKKQKHNPHYKDVTIKESNLDWMKDKDEATTFVSNLHTCHCLAVVAKSFRNRFIRNQYKHFTMGIRHDVEQGLEKYEITKIDGQPTDEDLKKLQRPKARTR